MPRACWITFDPTNRSVGGYNLTPLAAARHIRQIMPVTGSFVGDSNAFESMDVRFEVVSEVPRRGVPAT